LGIFQLNYNNPEYSTPYSAKIYLKIDAICIILSKREGFKINIFAFLKNTLIKLNIFIGRSTKINLVYDFLFLLRNSYFLIDLIRVGSPNDGGYLFPANLVDKFDMCISFGIGDNFDFESELAANGKIIYGVDGSIKDPGKTDVFRNFTSLYAASHSDDRSVEINKFLQHLVSKDKAFILKIDVEGDEYEVINNITEDILKKPEIIIVEFHHLDSLYTPFGYKIISSVFKKVLKYFYIAHIHPNNISVVYGPKGARIPNNLEITFVNRRHESSISKIRSMPHEHDARNVINKKNLVLPNEFWK
jgi:hypothetical protein